MFMSRNTEMMSAGYLFREGRLLRLRLPLQDRTSAKEWELERGRGCLGIILSDDQLSTRPGPIVQSTAAADPATRDNERRLFDRLTDILEAQINGLPWSDW
jgi:hypothetical protein